MTQDERTPQDAAARLDARLRELPHELEPGRDLWSGIAARIDAQAEPTSTARRGGPSWLWQAAAAVVLVAASSLLTATLLDRGRPAGQAAAVTVAPSSPVALPPDAAIAVPAAFGPSGALDPEYVATRRQLTQMLESRMATLPPSARARLEFNLGELRRAADEINAALAAQPGDPLLEELLLKTYQDELAVLSNVNQLTTSLGTAAASPAEKRIQL